MKIQIKGQIICDRLFYPIIYSTLKFKILFVAVKLYRKIQPL